MRDISRIVSIATTNYPKYKTVDGVDMELSGFEVSEMGVVPVYVESQGIGEEEALSILLGGAS